MTLEQAQVIHHIAGDEVEVSQRGDGTYQVVSTLDVTELLLVMVNYLILNDIREDFPHIDDFPQRFNWEARCHGRRGACFVIW